MAWCPQHYWAFSWWYAQKVHGRDDVSVIADRHFIETRKGVSLYNYIGSVRAHEYGGDCYCGFPWPDNAMLSVGAAVDLAHRMGGLTGIRCWISEKKRLRSLTHQFYWTNNPTDVTYHNMTHVAPKKDCSCGYYAVKPGSVSILLGAISDRVLWRADPLAIGVVSPIGKVMVHRHGWRAERVRIHEIWIPFEGYVDEDIYDDITWHVMEGVL